MTSSRPVKSVACATALIWPAAGSSSFPNWSFGTRRIRIVKSMKKK